MSAFEAMVSCASTCWSCGRYFKPVLIWTFRIVLYGALLFADFCAVQGLVRDANGPFFAESRITLIAVITFVMTLFFAFLGWVLVRLFTLDITTRKKAIAQQRSLESGPETDTPNDHDLDRLTRAQNGCWSSVSVFWALLVLAYVVAGALIANLDPDKRSDILFAWYFVQPFMLFGAFLAIWLQEICIVVGFEFPFVFEPLCSVGVKQ